MKKIVLLLILISSSSYAYEIPTHSCVDAEIRNMYTLQPEMGKNDVAEDAMNIAFKKLISRYDGKYIPVFSVAKKSDDIWLVRFSTCHKNHTSGGYMLVNSASGEVSKVYWDYEQ